MKKSFNFMTCEEISEKWGISERTIQIYCKEGRIPGAEKYQGVWHLPSDAQKPMRKKPGVKQASAPIPLRVLSLFSGCGGLDLGFEGDFSILKDSYNPEQSRWKVRESSPGWVRLPKTRFHTVFANDIRPDAKSVWVNFFSRYGIPESAYYLDSIVDLVKLHQNNKLSVFPSGIDVVTGGFPCQDFSVAGKRQGFNSDKSHKGSVITDEPSVESRGQLYVWMRKVVAITQPRMFIAENVKGLTNLSNVREIIEKDFSSVCNGGYIVVPTKVLMAADYGVPQSRERIIFFGIRKNALRPEALNALSRNVIPSEYDPYPLPTHSLNGGNGLLPYVSTEKCLAGLQEPDCSEDNDQRFYSKAKYQGRHCQGQTEINLKKIGPTIRSEHHGNIEFRRLSEEHFGNHYEELRMGMKERRLTIRECARIQTFPDDYHFIIPPMKDNRGVSASDAYKLVGNAVPPLLGFHIAMRIQELWDKYFY